MPVARLKEQKIPLGFEIYLGDDGVEVAGVIGALI